MKPIQKLLKLFCLIALSCLGYCAFAQSVNETEPNNAWNVANIIQLTQTGQGGRDGAGDMDWWRVTSTADGSINVWCYIPNAPGLCAIYDTLGGVLLASGDNSQTGGGPFNVTAYGLQAGTYYIKVYYTSNPNFTPFSIVPTWTNAPGNNDLGINDSKATATLKNIGDSITGHISYYYNSQRDSGDWYKIKPGTTKLYQPTVTINGADLRLRLYDSTGVTLLTDIHSASNFSLTPVYLTKNLNYYYRINSYDTVTYGSYTIKSPGVNSNETEPNDTWDQGKLVTFGANAVGKCATGGDGDWWRIKSTTDGKLSLALNGAAPLGISAYCEIFDTLGTALISGGQFVNTFSRDIGLKAGSYYIRIHTTNTADSLSYTFICTWGNAPYTNDAEPNDTKATATVFAPNTTKTGHSGYLNSTSNDTRDWYKIITSNDGSLSFTINVGGGTSGAFDLMDNNGTTVILGVVASSASTLNVNGLGKGTYYLRIKPQATTGYFGYQVSNTFTSSVTNDVEPNNDKTTAKVVHVNDSLTGNAGFYYNLKRDTSDWFKVTTTSDGDLRIYCYPLGGNLMQFRLYDYDGTTVLTSTQIASANSLFYPGLGAGTYYIKVNMSNVTQYSPYALKITQENIPPYTNDAEPNTYSTPLPLNQNDSATGHIAYYFQGSYDIYEFYKMTTTNDGALKLKVNYNPLNEIEIILIDSVGYNYLDSAYTQGSPTPGLLQLNQPNLKKGTYYVRIVPITNAGGYALKSTFTAPLANDPEPNGYAKNGTLIYGYTSKTGHVGYYGNGSSDSTDWWRIGFTGVGNLDVTYTGALSGQSAKYKLYVDTNAAPVDSQNVGTGYTHTYTGLTAGTYYISMTQIGTNYQDYTLTANYRDTTSATITLTSSSPGSAGICNTGKLTYFVTIGLPPYTVQLYRNGVAYGVPVTTNDTAKFTALTPDVYYATVKSTGAVTSVTASGLKPLVTTVTGHNAGTIQSTSAIVAWNYFPCVDGFVISYKKTTDATFTTLQVAAGQVGDTLQNLLPSTSYDYKVQAYVEYNNIKYYSGFTTVKTFTTLAPRLGSDDVQQLAGEISSLLVYPNPAQNELNIQIQFAGSNGNASLRIIDLTGRIMMEKNVELTLNQYSDVFEISNLQNGIYQLTITGADGKTMNTKVIKQ